MRRALAREERISATLREVGAALGTTLDLDELLELILSKLTELVEADRAILYLLDESNQELVSRVIAGQGVRSIRMQTGRGIAGLVAQTGRPIRVRDAYLDPRFERDWDVLTGYRTTSMLAAPLKNHLGRTIGVLQALNKRGADEFTDEDEALLGTLSTQAAVAIDNSRLFLSLIQKNKQLVDTKEELERRVQDLQLLFDLERATARATSIDELARSVLGALAGACGARGAALLLVQEDGETLVHYLFDASEPNELRHVGAVSDEGLLGAAMKSGLLRLEQASRDPRYSADLEGRYPFPVTSVLALELDGGRAPLGAIGLFSKSTAFTSDDVALTQLVAANVSTAVRLYYANHAREVSERLTSIGRLLSQVIHDFKAPMTVISGYVQLLQDTDDQATREQYVEEILKQFDLLTSMQREVLEFARGERAVFVRRVNLRKFFSEISRQLALELEGRPVELVLHVDDKVVVRFDEGRVARAVHNLARNAMEAMGGRAGRLTITAGLDQGDLRISVSDTGPGIPEDMLTRIFQPFVSFGKAGGSGLGLAIVKKIAEEHGGSVSVRSDAEGATFELRLPQPEPPSKSDPRPLARGEPAPSALKSSG